ncbi:MAG: AraC family transcriptional regulator, partial [Oscillospiraceae bacterium]|nr:AraC family transcriptional regulator [Oscillospiraceae bacterium]
NFWREIPAQIGQKIASGELERPDAVVCASDVMALALIEALQEGGIRVPEGAILCHCEERSFLLLSDRETPDIPTQAEAKMEELLQLQPPEVISISKPLQNGALSEQIMEIQRCMDALRQKIEHSSSYTSDYRQALHRMRLRITDQPQHDWSIEEIAKEIGISVSHLQRLYRELFGTTITEDVIAARITMAEYLLHTELRITEIAAECGYKSETHFMRQFKKRKGMTPTQFREQK